MLAGGNRIHLSTSVAAFVVSQPRKTVGMFERLLLAATGTGQLTSSMPGGRCPVDLR